ncbi:site-specific integrase [Maritalea mediterranea]|uniref:Site-specific integrase n=1 Tax=Maritalea mediterranea TaxID=2909667 RepID=A0ABS9E9S8_9HYPH|nr:site-specific integrase [Maritalea mediterranea]MCF4098206.1 site-specific integrase [Maritalea mediterranea]
MGKKDLTASNAQYAKPGDVLNDTVVRGLSLRVLKSRKSFYYFYRTKTGKQRRPFVGEYPAMTIPMARQAAREIMAQVVLGKDPVEEWEAARRDKFTVADLCTKYLDEYASVKNKKTTVENYRSMFRRHIAKSALGKTKVSAVEWEDIEALHARISRKTPVQANRVLAFLSKVFAKAERWRYRPQGTNPCQGVERNVERKRDRYLNHEEIAKLVSALQDPALVTPRMAATFWLLFLTGARRSEVAGRELLVDDGVIVLRDHKTDRYGRDRFIHVPSFVIELAKQNKLFGKKLPVPNRVTKAWVALRQKLGFEDVRLHDLRHSFASLALDLGYSLDQTGKQLGHSSTQTTAGYAHLMDRKSREMVEAVAKSVLVIDPA